MAGVKSRITRMINQVNAYQTYTMTFQASSDFKKLEAEPENVLRNIYTMFY